MAAEDGRGILRLLLQTIAERGAMHGDSLLDCVEMSGNFRREARRMRRDAFGHVFALRAESRLKAAEPIVERCGHPIAVLAEALVDADRALCDRGFERGKPIGERRAERFAMIAEPLIDFAGSLRNHCFEGSEPLVERASDVLRVLAQALVDLTGALRD